MDKGGEDRILLAALILSSLLSVGQAICMLTGTMSHKLSEIIVLLISSLITGLLAAAYIRAIRRAKILAFMIAEKKRKQGKGAALWNSEEEQKLDVLKKRVELSMLQSQINPHFLYNTLDSIRSLALLDGQKEIADMTEVLARFFRYCISSSERLVKISEELSHIEDYYYIQKYRFEDRFEMSVELETDEIRELYIPRMTLQPLVENAMIHGLEKTGRKGKLILRVFRTENKVCFSVEDNGVGMSSQQTEKLNWQMESGLINVKRKDGKHNSIAVSNVNAQIHILFGEEYGIHYRSMEGIGTQAIVTIPVVDDFNRNRYADDGVQGE